VSKLYITTQSETYLHVVADDTGVERELSDKFEFFYPGYQYTPSFKKGFWSGKIKMYNMRTKLIYRGLLPRILKFAKENKYKVSLDKNAYQPNAVTIEELQKFIKTLNLPLDIIPRDYQLKTILECINKKRLTVLSATSSGKSLIIYIVAKFLKQKTLIIVPTKTLVHQMIGDFKDYNCTDDIHSIYSGKDKTTNLLLSVTTWQSLVRMPKEWFDQFNCVIVDETHQAKAASITKILEKLDECEYRFGTTGTLDGEKTHRFIIEGLLGSVYRIVTAKQLMEDGILADLTIHAKILRHPNDIKNISKHWDYKKEIDYLISCQERNQYIVDLVLSKKGNNLVVFNFVEKHGDILHKMFQEQTDRPIYYIHGGIDATIRDDMRMLIEKESDAIIIAGLKAFATGTNIKRLDNIYFAHPSKSRITTLQAIGRVLRTAKNKISACLYDIADDLKPKNKGRMNFTMRHFIERLKIYKSERFHYDLDEVELENYIERSKKD